MRTVTFILWIVISPSIALGQKKEPTPRPSAHKEFNPSFSIKTNTLYWLILLPNIEAEVKLNKQFSINTEIQAAWWSTRSGGFYYQLLSASPEVRYRWGNTALFGQHHLSIYGSAGLYDILLKPNNNGFQGEFWSTGIGYGYTIPLGKRVALEFGIGIGYLQTNYKRYQQCQNGYLIKANEQTHWLGPTKAKASLVWQLTSKRAKQ